MFESSKPGNYDIILMDVRMPVMDGYEATKSIRASKHPQSSKIPVIAMSATSFDEDINKALASGMNDYIAKPININTLMLTISKYMD
ncbi:CAI-1 autoinducer sensor kinase/phosphatase CqsS [bioreactor metagenome]|uniref:CAI-1 autoinducer sensor kinase/phosphatase CqsS n=1 Tax=bioreactor metagenome TaxID=1076179 RepID=A0A645IDD5_9ZZZZ